MSRAPGLRRLPARAARGRRALGEAFKLAAIGRQGGAADSSLSWREDAPPGAMRFARSQAKAASFRGKIHRCAATGRSLSAVHGHRLAHYKILTMLLIPLIHGPGEGSEMRYAAEVCDRAATHSWLP